MNDENGLPIIHSNTISKFAKNSSTNNGPKIKSDKLTTNPSDEADAEVESESAKEDESASVSVENE